MAIADSGGRPSLSATNHVYKLFDDDRNPISEVPVPTIAGDIECTPVPESPWPLTDEDDEIPMSPPFVFNPDREPSPKPRPRVRFDCDPKDFTMPDPSLYLTPTKLNHATKKKLILSDRNVCLSPSKITHKQKNVQRSTSNIIIPSTKRPSGAVCSVLRTNNLGVRNFERGIKVPFSTLGPLVSAPGPPHVYTVHDHTMGTKTQKQLQTIKHSLSKGRKPVVSKVLGLQKCRYFEKSPMKSLFQRPTNYGASSETSKYANPEFHSTLKLARAMQKLKVSKINPEEELKKMMEEDTAQRIMQKAALPLNIPFTEKLYKDLTSVDVATGEIVAKLLQDQEARIKSHLPSPRPKDEMPDLMEFYDDSIYHDEPSWAVYFPPVNLDFAVSAPPDCAFSQYRRLRMWENSD